MAYLRIPSLMASGLLALTHNAVLLPIVTAPPISMIPVLFGIMLLMNLGLGLTTPPVGTALFVGCAIGNIRIERASRAMLYLWPAMVVVLLMVTYVPWFVNFLPNLLHVKQ